jgi:hypothetical protein
VNKRINLVSLVAAGMLSLAAAPSHAASGTVDLVISTTSRAYVVQMGESTVTASEGSGKLTFVNSTGNSFPEGANATVKIIGFSKTQPSGLELEADGVATFNEEDTLLLLFQRRAEDLGTSGEGNLELAGGTGRYAGVGGQCRYKTDPQSDEASVTIAKCQWLYSFPYR